MNYTFKDIFDRQNGNRLTVDGILIPMIQRDYAQGREDEETKRKRERFLDALYDALYSPDGITLDFIYGSVETIAGRENLIPLDGQQRLTTLFLLHWYAAKKDGIAENEYSFLRGFSYDTRSSSRKFCERLIVFDPSFKARLSDEIRDQSWFPLDWENDPTIRAMLVMLDAIDLKFRDVGSMWDALVNQRKITFYFLSIKNMGLTDEIYIKMNSRGKPLTPFEDLKAELERNLRNIDEEFADRVAIKIDNSWTDLLWQYTKPPVQEYDNPIDHFSDNYIVDDAFLNYFRFVCDIICYKEAGSIKNRTNNVYELVDLYFSSDKAEAEDHFRTLESYFDCWLNIDGYHDAKSFFNSFSSTSHTIGKITKGKDDIDILGKCLKPNPDDFTLPCKIFLYAVIEYLRHKDTIGKSDFLRRIRIINNLIENSRSSELNDGNNRIRDVLLQVDSIMCSGVIRDDDDIGANFNKYQLKEEKIKAEYLAVHHDSTEYIFSLEDHELLHGQVGIVLFGNDDTVDIPPSITIKDYVSRFKSLFDCDWDKVSCAMMTFGNYSQEDGNYWRKRVGGNLKESWKLLFHKFSINEDSGYNKTRYVLRKLLETNEDFSNEKLDDIIFDYLGKCEREQRYPWEYYFIKYEDFRCGKNKMSNINPESNPYLFMMMFGEKRTRTTTYMPYLYIALNDDDKGNNDIKYYDVEEGEFYLRHGDKYLHAENNCYRIDTYSNNDRIKSDPLDIPNDNGVDKVNRIDLLHDYLYSSFFVDD